jgi:hypothetical protein
MVFVRKTYSGTRSLVGKVSKAFLIVFGFALILFGRSSHSSSILHMQDGVWLGSGDTYQQRGYDSRSC